MKYCTESNVYTSVNYITNYVYRYVIIYHIKLLYYFQLSPLGTTVFRGIAAFDLDANRNKDILFGILPANGIVSLLM